MAVLVHGVAAGKGEWDDLARALWSRGFGTLALDLRGHGGSTRGPDGVRTYADFDRTGEWPRAAADLEAAVSWLAKKGIRGPRVGFIGGSIGANLATAADGAAWLALLSPGRDYRGVYLRRWTAPACLAASPEDAYAYETVSALAGEGTVLTAAHGHGAQMLREPGFTERLLSCVETAAKTAARPR